MNAKHVLLVFFLSFGFTAAACAGSSVNVMIDGQVAPGVYGRINIGNGPAPILVYPQPVVIYQQVRPVQASPIYLSVPPGHAKDWRKHCRHYNACGQQVYFVRSAEYESGYRDQRGRKDRYEQHDRHVEGRGEENEKRGHGRRHD